MEALAELFVILVAVRVAGELAERLGLPASVGELTAGIAMGSAALWFGGDIPFLLQLLSSEALEIAANLGIFFLVLVAGIEMEPSEIMKNSSASFAIAAGGVLLPLFSGIMLIWMLLPDSDARLVQALVVGVALSITAIPATVKVLTDLRVLHTKVGRAIVSAAIFDDILGLFLLAILLAVIDTGHVPDVSSLLWLLGQVVFFFVVTVLLGVHVYPRVRKGVGALQVAAVDLSALAAAALAYGWLAEALSMHWILGAFMAGLYFEPSRVGRKAYNEMRLICGAVTKGFLGPLFFFYIGRQVDLSAVTAVPGFLLVMLLVAFGGKAVGAGLPALCFGFARREAVSVGVGMSARGAVELVILSVAYSAGVFSGGDQQDLISTHLYSSLVLTGVITTMVVSLILPRLMRRG